MKNFYIRGCYKESYCTNILTIRIHNFLFDWFIDCGEWFIYFHFCKRSFRFSGAGNMIEKHTKESHLKWLKEYR